MPKIQFDYVSYTLAHTLARAEGYCGVSIVGTSMTEAGIRGGDLVVFEKYYEWVDGAIMLIMQEKEGQRFSQMHRVRRIRGKWFQCWEDGSGTRTQLDDSCWPQGILVAVARNAHPNQGE